MSLDMLWYGKPVAEKLEGETRSFIEQQGRTRKYISIIMPGVDHPGAAYVRSKEKCAQRLGLTVKIFSDEEKELTDIDMYNIIHACSSDEMCVGIMVQLPLPSHLEAHKEKILNAIPGYKDIDGLSMTMHQIAEEYPSLFTPATPRAVLAMIDYYAYDLLGKKIAMIGYSNLIGKPLTSALRARGAHVEVFTVESNQHEMKKYCREVSDMIISATGHIHLIDEQFVRNDQSQVVIDVGRGYKDDKAVGDVDREKIESSVCAITPVPGGVGPVTVASLFANIISLHMNAEKFSSFFEE